MEVLIGIFGLAFVNRKRDRVELDIGDPATKSSGVELGLSREP